MIWAALIAVAIVAGGIAALVYRGKNDARDAGRDGALLEVATKEAQHGEKRQTIEEAIRATPAGAVRDELLREFTRD